MNFKKNYHQYLLKESILGFIYRRFFLFPILRLLTGPEFLDVGCGKGIMLNYGNSKSFGIDINEYNISYIKSKGKKALKINDDGIFPLKDNSFKVIICDQVLEHIENPSLLLSEMHRCLNLNGKLIIGVPQKKGFLRDSDHKIFYDIEKIYKLLEKNNFRYKFHFYLPLPFKIFGNFISQQSLYIISSKTINK